MSIEDLLVDDATPIYTPREGSPDELTIVCANCSFPVVKEYTDDGRFTGFREEIGPATEEQALAEGWLDHGMGFFCPKCSLSVLEEQARDQEIGAENGIAGDIGEIVDAQVLRTFVPHVSDDTIAQFVKMFRSERLSKFRVLAGLESLPIHVPVPKSDAQAKEFIEVVDSLARANGEPTWTERMAAANAEYEKNRPQIEADMARIEELSKEK